MPPRVAAVKVAQARNPAARTMPTFDDVIVYMAAFRSLAMFGWIVTRRGEQKFSSDAPKTALEFACGLAAAESVQCFISDASGCRLIDPAKRPR